jgi:ABC-type phosphate transport system permease subunit
VAALAIGTAGGAQISALAPSWPVFCQVGSQRGKVEPAQPVPSDPHAQPGRPPGGILLVALFSAISGAVMGCLFGGFLTVALTIFLAVPLGVALGIWASRFSE